MRGTRDLAAVLACLAASGCGGSTATTEPPAAAQKDVAQRFAAAVFRGQSDAAVQLLIHPDDAALSQLARRAALPWKTSPARLLLPARRAGRHWIFRYTGRQTHADGRFDDVRGHLTVIVGATGVEFFTLRNDDIRFSTHHDSQLLPSNR